MSRSFGSLLLLGALAAGEASASQGTEFWAVYSVPSEANDLSVVVSNPDPARSATVLVETEDGMVDSAVVGPRAAHEFMLTGNRSARGSVLDQLAFRIRSDIPIVAFQSVSYDMGTGSSSASLLVDSRVLGAEYLVVAVPGTDPLRPSVVTLVAPGNVDVEVTPTVDTAAGPGVPAIAAGVTTAFSLRAFDVLQLAAAVADTDLSGTHVIGDAPVEVFGGCHRCQPHRPESPDDAQELMFPLSWWVRDYHAVTTTPATTDLNRWRILAAVDGTTVSTDPPQPGTPVSLDRGEYHEFAANADFEVSASDPVLVTRFIAGGSGCPGGGDPAMGLMVPPERYTTDAVFATTNRLPGNWLDIVAPPGATVAVDGVGLPPGSLVPFGSGAYGHAQLLLDDSVQTHTVTSDAPAGLYVGSSCEADAQTHIVAMAEPPNLAPTCDAGGPYDLACAGPVTALTASGLGSSDPESAPLTYAWSSPAAELWFDDDTLAEPTVFVAGLGTFDLDLEVSDGTNVVTCSTTVRTTGSAVVPPELDRFTTPLLAVRAGSDVVLSWQDLGPLPTAYNVYAGSLGGALDSHSAIACTLEGTPAPVSRRQATVTPGGGSVYLLMSASSCAGEGDTGADPLLSSCPP